MPKYIGFDRALDTVQLLNQISYDLVQLVDDPHLPIENTSVIVGIVPSYPEVEHNVTVTVWHNDQTWSFSPQVGYSETPIQLNSSLEGLWKIEVSTDRSSSPALWTEWGIKCQVVPEPSIGILLTLGWIVALLWGSLHE